MLRCNKNLPEHFGNIFLFPENKGLKQAEINTGKEIIISVTNPPGFTYLVYFNNILLICYIAAYIMV